MLEPKCERNVQLSYGLGMSVLADVPITSPELVVGLSCLHSPLEIANQTFKCIMKRTPAFHAQTDGPVTENNWNCDKAMLEYQARVVLRS